MKFKLLNVLIAVLLFLIPHEIFAQAPPLGAAANFVLFTTVGAVTNSGTAHLTHLTGHVGSNSGSTTGFGNVDGVMHDGDIVSGSAAADLGTAYGLLNSATPTFFPSGLLGNGDTLLPGVYHIASAATLNLNLYLDAEGDPNAVFIFQIEGSLSTGASSKVKLINGALACNVFWKVEGLVSMATGTFMRGTVVAHNAAINMSPLDSLEGRALSINGAITTNSVLAYMPLGCGTAVLTGPAAPSLVSTAAYAAFSSIGPVTNTGITYVKGDVGTNSGLTTGFDPLLVTGMIHPVPDASTIACAGDLTNVYNYLNTLPINIELLYPAQFGNDLVLTPHTYLLNAATALIGSIYLNAQGNPNAVFVIHVNGALTPSASSHVYLINGAKSKNVYWLVNGAVNIGGNSLFNGTIVGTGAITLNTGDTLYGRALTTVGAVNINGSYLNSTPDPCVATPISGRSQVCQGDTIRLSNTDTGGVWTSFHPSIATVGSLSGIVTGVTSGIDTILYVTTLACEITKTIVVNPAVSPITGLGSVCVGNTIALSSTTLGGTWISSSVLRATVGTTSGIVTGVSAGTATISYFLGTGCLATKTITINAAAAAITGPNAVCVGTTITLSDISTGGTWSSNAILRATIGSLSGIVTGVSAGTATISYVLSTGCLATKSITVNPAAAAITGANAVCVGTTTTMSNTSTGGTWSSNAPLMATIGSVSGIVTGVSAGTATISYVLVTGCLATKTITINPAAAAITGANAVCVGSTTTMSNTSTGGTWSSNAPLLATIGSVSGIVTAVSAGTATISYVLATGCLATKTITVNPAAAAITGANAVCVGSTTTMSNTSIGGTWSSNTLIIASVGSITGIVTGVSAGTATISYVLGTGCLATKTITVNPAAAAITGANAVCMGRTTVMSNLSTGGTWSSSAPVVATIGSISGIVTGVFAGTATISYVLGTGCLATKILTVNPTPAAISGPSSVCEGSTITMSSTSTGGTWSTSAPVKATIGSVSGIVTGVSAGTATITYVLGTGCLTTKAVTVNPATNPGVITGSEAVCVGGTTVFSNTTPGGVWSSSNLSATVVGGTVTGITAGSATISYTVTGICGTASATKTITIITTATAGTITGASTVCVGSSTVLTPTIIGGTWSSSSTSATVVGGTVTGVTVGTTTISYTVTEVCGTATTTKTMTIGSPSSAGIITGSSTVCVGSTTVLSNTTPGGTWSSSSASATVAGGTVAGITPGTATISYSVVSTCGTAIATKTMTILPNTTAGTITGLSFVCIGSTITLSNTTPGGIWSSSSLAASVAGGTVTGLSTGTATISYSVTGACGTAVATKTLNVGTVTDAGVITGFSNVCIGFDIVLSNTTLGGTWSSSSSSATVAGGTVTGISVGTATISYTIFSTCGSATATKTIEVGTTTTAGVITGASSVCEGATITLANATTGGVWTVTNGNASVTDGEVTGIIVGIDTIVYTVSNSCGTASTTKEIIINPLPDAGFLSGLSAVCVGSSVTFSPTVSGGVWSATNGTATVVGGLVTGMLVGIDTIDYAVTNTCGTAVTSKSITINAIPSSGTLVGPSSVCIGSSITITPSVTGGAWSVSNGTATVIGGIVSGVAAGVDTISYEISNSCGTATITKTITINPIPDAGILSGSSIVCVGSVVTFTPTIFGGAWSASNSTATVVGGVVTGVSTGIDTISYTITNTCGSAVVTKTITISPLPVAGSLSGPSVVCEGSSVTFTSSVTGGIWSASNSTATVIGGVVTGVTSGIDTISYTVTNFCGTAVVSKTITINPLPVAGILSGSSVVCAGSSVTFTPTIFGGVWSASNGTATVSGGVVTGVTAGIDTISYTFTNSCGTAVVTKTIAINPLPVAGSLSGLSDVCIGSSVTFTPSVTGGVWSASNGTATVVGGVVTGVTTGIDTISYAVSNSCGTAIVSKTISINPLPFAGSLSGLSEVCVGATITITPSVTGGVWSAANGTASVSGGVVTGITAGVNTISYSITNSCGTDVATKAVTINPLPNAGVITGASGVCIGATILLTNTIPGGIWSASNTNATVAGGIVTGVRAGLDTIAYAISNMCGTAYAYKVVTINTLPVVPVISTKAPSPICRGTLYQNFGAPTLPPANTTYNWTATNAFVWAQGVGHQYSLVSFLNIGDAFVTLTATTNGTLCTSSSTVMIKVSEALSHTDVVSYFNNHFVCTPNTDGSYQWGYDDKRSLDSTILIGEINQDYINTAPDFTNKNYWVLTMNGGCMQKTYFSVPTTVQFVNNEFSVVVYPNPASTFIHVSIHASDLGNTQLDVLDMSGRLLSSAMANNKETTIDVATLPAGIYLLNCYNNGVKVTTSRFTKN